jgi:molecular chaperone HscB
LDYFSFLGLSRKLNIDTADLEQRYRALSRQHHPDYFYNAPPAERRASLERSSYLNDAYRTLRNRASRIEYLLKLEGALARDLSAEARSDDRRAKADGFSRAATAGNGRDRAGGESSAGRAIPPALLEEVFALNEELDDIREDRASGAAETAWKARLERARAPIEQKRVAHEAALEELSRRWDTLVDVSSAETERRCVLDQLRDRFQERNYINNLLAGIERELAS